MEAKKLNAATGWLWIKQGNYLFRKSPILWVSITFIGVVGLIGVASIPVIGDPLATLLFPVMFAGFLTGCRALEHDEELELAHLFAGFHHNTQQLITLGGLNLVLEYLIFGVMKITGGAALVDILMNNTQTEDPTVLAQAIAGAGIAVMLGLILFTALLMATQFAPMLVAFDKVRPLDALKASLRGCLSNMLPLSLYGMMMLLFAIAASLPMMLGWFILLPIMITSIYAAYRGIFPGAEAEKPGTETEEIAAHNQSTSQDDE